MEEYKTFVNPTTVEEYWAVYAMSNSEFIQYSPEDQEQIICIQDWVQSKMD